MSDYWGSLRRATKALRSALEDGVNLMALPEYVEDAIAIDDPQGECPHCDARRAAIWRFVREQRAEVYERCATACASMADDSGEDYDSRGAAAALANIIHRLAAEEAK